MVMKRKRQCNHSKDYMIVYRSVHRLVSKLENKVVVRLRDNKPVDVELQDLCKLYHLIYFM